MGIKQEVLAFELGEDWSQKKISLLEQKEEVEEKLIRQVAKILKVPEDAIKYTRPPEAFGIGCAKGSPRQLNCWRGRLIDYSLLSHFS